MATANFRVINAKSYYVINDTYEVEGEEVERDGFEWEDIMDDIRHNETFPNPSYGWDRNMDARELCGSDANWQTFGNGKAWTTETSVESMIVIRSGYYSGAVLDYNIKVDTNEYALYLSDYNGRVDDLIDDYLDSIQDIVAWKGSAHGWNVGTFKIQKKNIRKWIEKRINEEIEKCEDFCKRNSEDELRVSARFSNGETWYSKVG
jgi:hypothetical protein